MKKRTKYGQILIDHMTKVADILLISLLWLVFSIPIFTIGASTCAMITTINKFYLKQEGYLFKQFFKSFKNCFKQATIVTVFSLFIYSTLYLNTNLIRSNHGNILLLTFSEIFLVILTLSVISLTPYVFSYISRFSDSLKIILKNCYVLSLMNFWKTGLMLLITISFAGILWLIPISVIVLPAGMAILLCKEMKKIFYVSITNL